VKITKADVRKSRAKADADAVLYVRRKELFGVEIWEVANLLTGDFSNDRDLRAALLDAGNLILANRAIRSKEPEVVPARKLRVPMALRPR